MRKSLKKTTAAVLNEADRVLIRILAEMDSVWLPMRDWTMPRPTNTHEARELFRLAGVAWSSSQTTEAGRKSSQRLLEVLADKGRVLVRRPTMHRSICVKLSDHEEAATRSLCGLPGMYGTWLAMTRLNELGGCASEFSMTDRNLWPHDQQALENMFLPALTREYVIGASTINGEVRYSITSTGKQWLAESSDPTDHPGKENSEAVEAYNNYVVAALDKLQTLKPKSTRELGMMPLSVGDY